MFAVFKGLLNVLNPVAKTEILFIPIENFLLVLLVVVV